MKIIQDLISSDKYGIKCPYLMNPIGIVIHNTANDASARNEITYMQSNNNEVSFHIAIDDLETIQGIPFNRNTWHAGDGGSGNGNRNYISIEICYSKSGGDRFAKAEQRAAKEVAALLKQYGWNINNVKKHQDFSNKYCPHRTLDMGWQRFLNMVQVELNGQAVQTPNQEAKPVPQSSSKSYIYLKPHVTKWNVYPTNVAPVIGNQCGALAPSQFDGLKYEILGNPQKDVYTIQTQNFGKVNIYVPKDDDSEFINSNVITVTSSQPNSNKKYLNLKPHVNSWRVYPLNRQPVVGNECGTLTPANYGGLSYEILEDKGDVKIIQTQSFGRVQIYAPRDNDSTITNSPTYEN